MGFSRYLALGCSLPPGMDPGLDSKRVDSAGPFSRVSHKFYRRARASPARTRRSSPRAPRREFLLFAARRAERRETMAVFAAKLKPPTDFSYFADEPSLRSWLSCAKSPLGVSRFILASRMHQPRAIHVRYIEDVPFLSVKYRDFQIYFASTTTLMQYFYLSSSANTLYRRSKDPFGKLR